VPLGETGGVHYADGCFIGIDHFNSLYVNITIYTEPDNKDGLYFQLYQSTINGVGFYFGLLTGIHYLDGELIERFVLFSRWETNDLANVRTVEGGWSEKGDDYGPFVGVRKAYNWTTHRYRFKLAYMESDSEADWYGMWVHDIDENSEVFCGSIRFPFGQSGNTGIDKCSTSWTEIYYKGVRDTPIPRWHVSIDGICATDQMIGTREMWSVYSSIQHSDIYYDAATKAIHFIMGPEVTRQHNAGTLCQGNCFQCAY